MAVEFRDSDVKKFVKDLQKQGLELTDGTKRVVNEVSLLVESSAKEAIKNGGHIVTNRLRSSVHAEIDVGNFSYSDDAGKSFDGSLSQKPKRTKKEYEVWVGTNVEYAGGIHRRTPFLEIAFEQNRNRFFQELRREINKPRG